MAFPIQNFLSCLSCLSSLSSPCPATPHLILARHRPWAHPEPPLNSPSAQGEKEVSERVSVWVSGLQRMMQQMRIQLNTREETEWEKGCLIRPNTTYVRTLDFKASPPYPPLLQVDSDPSLACLAQACLPLHRVWRHLLVSHSAAPGSSTGQGSSYTNVEIVGRPLVSTRPQSHACAHTHTLTHTHTHTVCWSCRG